MNERAALKHVLGLTMVSLALAGGCKKDASPAAVTVPPVTAAPANPASPAAVAPPPERPKQPRSQSTPPTTDFVTVADPVENAFTLGMPRGWQNRTYSARVLDVHSMVATSISPDGSVVIYSGDPSIPQYWNPAAATPIQYQMAQGNPRMRIEPFVPAVQYFSGYVQRKFGRLPKFKLLGIKPNRDAEVKLRARFAEAGMQMAPTVADVKFTYEDNGKPMRALVIGSTIDSGSFWMAQVSGITTSGDPQDYVPMLDAMGRSHKMNPQWQAQQNQLHQQRMAQIQMNTQQMTAQHQRNMAAIQQSAQAHQQRMQGIWSQNDASTKAFNDRMAAGDTQQRNFLNYINDENTVVNSAGQTYQVDNNYQRYFINKNDGTYVGGDIRMDADQLRTMGLNPDDYEEAKIKQ